MKFTIADIAQKAGVSKATVSRVLNNQMQGVGPETRARIQAIVRETGYQPSAVARGLATGVSRSVGLIIPDISNPFHTLLVRGAESALNQSGYSLFLCNTDRNVDKECDYMRVLMEKGVDGVILDSAASDCDGHVAMLEDQGIPVVLLDRIIDKRTKHYGVFLDNRDGARQAARHLFARRDRMLVFLNGPPDLSQSVLRRAGVEDVVREKGLPAHVLSVVHGDFSMESGVRVTNTLLDQAQYGPLNRTLPFNAIFAANDVMAVGVLQALKRQGVAVPAEVEVIGFDDIDLARLVDPPLTTVHQPALEMGARSVELLLRLIAGDKPRPKVQTLMPSLVFRESTQAMDASSA